MPRQKNQIYLLIFMFVSLPFAANAQGTKADYQRANSLHKLFGNRVFKRSVTPHWFANNNRFWYRNDLAGGKREFIAVDAVKGERKRAFDHQRLAKELAEKLKRNVSAEKLPFQFIQFNDEMDTVSFSVGKKSWRCDLNDYRISVAENLARPEQPDRYQPDRHQGKTSRSTSESPDKVWRARIEEHNVVLTRKGNKGETELSVLITTDGSDQHYYESHFFWSPDANKLVVFRTIPAESHDVRFVESSPKEHLQPRLHTFNYLKPGDRIANTKPVLIDILTRKVIPISDELFPNPWEINNLVWATDSSRFWFRYNQRGHRVLRIIGVNAEDGSASITVNEEPESYVDYANKSFSSFHLESDELIWMSERDGWCHLYLIDIGNGEVKNQITSGSWVVRRINRIDEQKRQIWFEAGGIYPEQDPYYLHSCRVDFDGSNLVRLTEGNGTHRIQFSPDRKYLIDSWSRVDLPPVTELRNAETGKLVCELEQSDASQLYEAQWPVPERFVAKARDGETDIYGVIFRPSNFDETKKYPVIEKIYAGPHGSFVPKSFADIYSMQKIAELGFIVVQMDGMGTSNRSKAFQDVSWKNIADSGFPDRILWHQTAAKKYPQLDLTRVGIYGGSAGGQSAMRALLAHGDFYKVAIADCGCHDNRMDKIWWNELYMSWPIGPHYEEQSNVTNAHRLQGKLMLVVGELDRNVDPASTMQVVNALIRADKDFDLLVIPGAGHGAADSAYGKRRSQDFFVRHLLGVEPRSK